MKNTIEQIHQASQYLAAAGISFLDKKDDDSHTNLGWDGKNSRLTTHPFDDSGTMVGLDICTGDLQWIKEEVVTAKINIEKSTHSDILSWFRNQVELHEIKKEYHYAFHYEIPYPFLQDNSKFQLDKVNATAYAKQLTMAKSVFDEFLLEYKLKSPVRMWPHHFDLGIYTSLKEGLDFGAGLAIPDTLVDALYFYASGWKGGKSVPTKTFDSLSKGNWRSDWDGATLESKDVNVDEGILFLTECRTQFLN